MLNHLQHIVLCRRRSWLGRLYVEDCNVGFANFHWSSSTPSPTEQGAAPQYRFLQPSMPGSYLSIKLDGMGPKLLVSDLSTADQPVLRWRLAVRGNTAVEFGVVPLNMVVSSRDGNVSTARVMLTHCLVKITSSCSWYVGTVRQYLAQLVQYAHVSLCSAGG